MTNNSDVKGIRISQPVYLFTVLMAGIVALLVISASMTRTDVVRPHPTPIPVDPFANLTYQSYTSLDGTFTVEHPTLWTPQENPTLQLVTDFVPANSDMQTAIRIYFAALRASKNLPADTSPEGLVKELLQQADGAPDISPVEVSGLKGVCGLANFTLQDNTKSKVENCVVPLDSANEHLVVITGITHADQWSRMEPVMQRLKSSLQIKVESVIARIAAVLGTQAPIETATPVATAEATSAATSEATQAATEAATSEATAAPTSEATQAATAEATP
ncbi:MAG: hypothetical protein KF716_12775 [Anaerolineae bacterium]|nr:hypothetical protein [Anaerolineae bacterium]